MRSRSDDILPTIVVTAVVLLVLWCVFEMVREYLDCDQRGGTMVRTMWGGYVCAKELN